MTEPQETDHEAEDRKREQAAYDVLIREGWRFCDIGACNCGSWHRPEQNPETRREHPIWKLANRIDAHLDGLRDRSTGGAFTHSTVESMAFLTAEIRGHVAKLEPQETRQEPCGCHSGAVCSEACKRGKHHDGCYVLAFASSSPRGPQKDETENPEHDGLTDWQRDCLKWRGKVLTGARSHWCFEWDELPVDETCDEWPCGCVIGKEETTPKEPREPHAALIAEIARIDRDLDAMLMVLPASSEWVATIRARVAKLHYALKGA